METAPGGVQSLISQIKETPLQKIAQQGAQLAISSLPIGQEQKDALSKLGQSTLQKFIPGTSTIGSIISKPKGPGGVMDKPDQTPMTSKPNGNIPKFGGISGFDKFKNLLSGIGSKFGLTTHRIQDIDYIWKPKLDKDGKVMINQKTGEQEGKYVFDWTTARQNDKAAGKATRTEFDINPLLNLGLKAATKGAM